MPTGPSQELTPLVVNNTIVKMRGTIGQAKFRLSNKLLKRIRQLKEKKGTEEQKEKNHRKSDRLLEEVQALKKIKPNEIGRFALINLKSENELMKEATNAAERALYKLAIQPLIMEGVKQFRVNYPDWPQKAPFILQRLGLQYRGSDKKQMSQLPPSPRLVEAIKSPSKPKQSRKEQKLKLKLAEDATVNVQQQAAVAVPLPVPKPIEIMSQRKGETQIRRIDLDRFFVDDSDSETDHEKPQIPPPLPEAVPSSSFFLGGVDSDSDHKSGDDDEKEKPKTRHADRGSIGGFRKSKRLPAQRAQYERQRRVQPTTTATKQHRRPSTNENVVQMQKSARVTAEPKAIHPSWEAKQQQKKKQQHSMPTGKKMRFDD